MRRLLALPLTAAIVAAGLAVTAAPATAAPTVLLNDTFTRTTTGGWGTASPTGGTYDAADPVYTTNGSQARVTVAPGWTRMARNTATGTDVDAKVTFSAPTWPATGLLHAGIRMREQTTGPRYLARVKLYADKTATVNLLYGSTASSSVSLTTDVPFASGLTSSSQVNLRTQVVGTNPVTLRAKAWLVGQTEPTTWTTTATDSSATRITSSGKLGLYYYSSSGSGSNFVAAADNFYATTYENVPPTAAYTADTSNDLRVTYNATGSTDTDGTITNYAWNYGDGTTGTGVTSEHTYTSTGNKTVTLTVTDNTGATHTTSKTVTVTDTHAPTVPAALNAALAPGATTLSWAPSTDGTAGTGVTSYAVSRNSTVISNSATTTYTDTTAPVGTSVYTVNAIDGAGNISAASSPVTVTRRTNPAAVTGLSATSVTNNSLSLAWTPNGDIDEIRVTRNGTALPTSPLPKTATTVAETALAPKTTYTYGVTTANTSTSSSGSQWTQTSSETSVSATTNPDKPSTPTVTGTGTATSTTLTWAPATDAATYRITRNGTPIATVPSTTLTYTDAALPSKTAFTYTVEAINVTGTTASTPVTISTTNAAPTAVANATSTDLKATLAAAGSGDVDGTIATYAWDFGDGTTGTGATVTHRYATNGTKTATLTVTDDDGATATTTTTFTVTDTNAPSSPANVSATLDASAAKAVLTWTASSDGDGYGVSGYRIYDNGTLLTSVAAPATTWTSPDLSAGTHNFTLRAVDSSPATNVSGASAAGTVTVEDVAPAVTGVSAAVNSSTAATLTWTQAGSPVTGIRVVGAPTGQPLVARSGDLPANTVSFSATGLNSASSYTYRVDTFNSRGTTQGTPVSFTTKRSAPTPSTLTASATTTTGTTLSWTATTNTDTYDIYQGTTKLASVPATTTSYVVSGLSPATGFTFRIDSVGDATTGSNNLNVTTKRLAPAAPVVTASGTTTTGTTLTWTATTNTDTYDIYQGTTKLATVPAATLTYTVNGLTPATAYTFHVDAVGDATTGSNNLNVTTKRLAPSAPVVSASAVTSTGTTLSWAATTNTDTYNVYNGSTKLATVPAATLTYTVTGLSPATGYTFHVDAVGDATTNSNNVTVTTKRAAPAAPAVTASAVTATGTTLTWATTTNTDTYDIYQGTTKLASVPGATTSYVVSGLSPATAYTFHVDAVGDAVTSSPTVNVTTKRAAPNAPAVTATATTTTGTTLTWAATTNTDTYNVYNGSTKLATVPAATTTYVVSGLSPATAYTFHVDAVGDATTNSNDVTVTTKRLAPGTPNVSASATTTTGTTLTWATTTNTDTYDIYQGTTKLATVPAATTTYVVTGLSPATGYTFHVDAVGDAVTSSPTVNVTTKAPNVAPTAAFTTSISASAVTTNAATSADSDGTITNYAWNYGDGTTGTGVTTNHTYALNGTYTLALTVTDNDGATATTSKTVTINDPVIVNDDFTRTVTNSLGTASSRGGDYLDSGSAYSVNGTEGRITGTGGATNLVRSSATGTDIDSTITLGAPTWPAANIYTGARLREQANGGASYLARVKMLTDKSASVSIGYIPTTYGAFTSLAGDTTFATGLTTSSRIKLRTQVSGTNPVTIKAKAWVVGQAEPSTWNATATDSSATRITGAGTFGTYYYASAAYVGALDDFTVTMKRPTPNAPNVTASGTTTTGTTLTWAATTNTDTYNVYQGTTKLATVPAATLTYTVTGLSPATAYTFHVDAVGDATTGSNNLNVTTKRLAPSAPVVSASAVTSTGTTLTWASTTNTDTYDVYNGTTKLATVPATTTSYVVSGLSPATAYTYHVDAVGDATTSSPAVNVTTKRAAPNAPVVTASATTTTGTTLTWAATTNTDSFDIYQGATKLATVPAATLTYTVTGLSPATAYTFHVDAIGDDTTNSNDVTITTKRLAPNAPVVTTSAVTSTGTTLTWASTTNTDTYDVYNGTTKLATVPAATLTYTVTGLSPATAYTFHVDAVGDATTSSNNATATTKRAAPNAPVVTASATTTTGTTLTWAATTNTDTYDVYNGTTKLATVPAATTSYVVSGLSPATAYTFHVDAVGDATTSSNNATVTTTAVNVAPTAAFTTTSSLLTVTANAGTSTDPDGSITNYAWNYGDNTTGTGVTTNHTYNTNGTYTLTLTVTDNNGATATTSKTVTVTDPTIINDNFNRTVTGSLGTASTRGGTYLDSGSAYSVNGTEGRITGTAGATNLARSSATGTDIDSTITLGAPTWPAANIYTGARLREQANGGPAYLARVKMLTDKSASVSIGYIPTTSGTFTSLAGDTTFATGLTTSSRINLRTQVSGTNPVTIKAKAWVVGQAEPSTWNATATDATATRITGAGTFGTYYYASAAYVGAIDNFTAAAITAPNTAPTAAYTTTFNNRAVTANAGTSTDPDGSITNYAWNYGDNTTGTGVTTNHTYTTNGTYTLTLTVTDNNGATATTSKTVVVSATPAATGRPDTTNTGVTPGRALTITTGDITVTTAGTIIENQDIYGRLIIKANNVTVRNTIIRGAATAPTSGGDAVLYITAPAGNDYTGYLLEDITVTPQTPNVRQNGININSTGTIRRANISGTVDGIMTYGGALRVEASYLHDFVHYDVDPSQTDGSHNDTIQVQAGNGTTITGNTLVGATNTAIMVTQDAGTTTNLTITGNYLDNGSCSINYGSGGAPKTGLVTTNNRFGTGQTLTIGGEKCAIIRNATASPLTASGNVWDVTGTPVTIRNG